MIPTAMGQYSRRGDAEWRLLQHKLFLEKIRLASSFLALQTGQEPSFVSPSFTFI